MILDMKSMLFFPVFYFKSHVLWAYIMSSIKSFVLLRLERFPVLFLLQDGRQACGRPGAHSYQLHRAAASGNGDEQSRKNSGVGLTEESEHSLLHTDLSLIFKRARSISGYKVPLV